MSEDEKKEHAARLLEELCRDPEFGLVYEDEDLEDVDEDTQKEIFAYMNSARINVSW